MNADDRSMLVALIAASLAIGVLVGIAYGVDFLWWTE